ncbi:MAG TPA: hypothetical protein VFE54_09760 [Mucilaginibacter sp.]|jgi:hypothetical protein|nr:hypothetical protein [Mucilaginibacter sp.]
MIKWFVYIVFALILIPCLSYANITRPGCPAGDGKHIYKKYPVLIDSAIQAVADTTPKKQQDDKKKIKQVTKAKPVPKPEKVDDGTTTPKTKPKRQRRPPGMERPPEIPRHNGD